MSEALSIVDAVTVSPMMITWDLGRRCNYDCTYCPSHRHDNFSPLASLDELKSSADFVFQYLSLMMPYRKERCVSISFTGGEPTVNPNFIKFGKWLKTTYQEKYKDQFYLTLSLTTNGATSRAMCDNLIENYDFTTISYHCESSDKFKKKVIDNILYLSKKKFPLKVNVMFHAREDYFKECIDVCELLERKKIDFIPRMIGEHKENNRYEHKYTDEQMAWMKNFWKNQKNKNSAPPKNSTLPKALKWLRECVLTKPFSSEKGALSTSAASKCEKSTVTKEDQKNKHSARSLGRPCCGKREMNVCGTDRTSWQKTSFLSFAEFKGWHCSVNWFFLHIEQQTGLVYHHQTCQATFDRSRGPIGCLKESDKIINNLKQKISDKSMPIVICPNKLCGCGLCTPKAALREDFEAIFPQHVDQSIFVNTQH